MHGAKNLNPVITLKNLLPPGRGPMLRDGPALAIPDRDGETGPATRLLRKTGELHRQPYRDGRAGFVVSECRHGLAIASESLLKTARAE